MRVHLRLLGRLHVRAGASSWDVQVEKRFLLLAHLACHDGWLERDKLAFLCWPDVDENRARANLRQLLKRASSYPFAHGLLVEPRALRWDVESDVGAFRQALGAGAWAEAVRLYGGELLLGVAAGDGSGLASWLELERESLQRQWREACLRSALASGQRDEAPRLYERFRTQLAEELALEVALERVSRFADGRHFVSLAPLDGPTSIGLAVAERVVVASRGPIGLAHEVVFDVPGLGYPASDAEFIASHGCHLQGDAYRQDVFGAIDLEVDNLRPAWARACEASDVGTLTAMQSGLGRYLERRSRFHQGVTLFAEAHRRLTGHPQVATGLAVWLAAFHASVGALELARYLGEIDQAERHCLASLSIARANGLLDEAARLFEDVGDRHGIATTQATRSRGATAAPPEQPRVR